MLTKTLLTFLLLISINLNVRSSHIYGGDSYFTQIGPNQFKISVRLFRKCNNALPVSDTIKHVGIYDNSTDTICYKLIIPVDSMKTDTVAYLDTNLGICTEVYYYEKVITLINNPNGYYLSWEICCRPPGITNLANVFSGSGWTWTAAIPNPAIAGGNSNPIFNSNLNDYYLNVSVQKQIDASCVDVDGDSLVYSLVTPMNFSASSSPPVPKPFLLHNWNSGGYSLSTILGTAGTCFINQSGIITMRSNQIGMFVVAIKCEEYRNGIKIGEVFRDITIISGNRVLRRTDSVFVCDSYTSRTGKVYNSSGTFYDTINASLGVDSIIKTVLSKPQFSKRINLIYPYYYAYDSADRYQWLDCSSGYSLFFGDTGRWYAIPINGSYAVEVTINGCKDTTHCYSINNVGIEGKTINDLNVYPNPTTEILNIDFENKGNYSLFSIDGKQILQNGRLQPKLTSIDMSNLNTGIYILRVITDEANVITKRIIKE